MPLATRPQYHALTTLLGSETTASFLASHWPHEPFALHQPLSRLPDVVRSPLLLEPNRLTRAYRGPIEITNGGSGQYRVTGPDPAVYFDSLGLAVRFTGLEDYLAGARPWLRALERDLGVASGAASMHAFINAEGVGLPPHCDPHEHIAIQLSGTKTFRYCHHPETRWSSASHSCGLPPSRAALVQSPTGLPDWKHLPEDATDVTLTPGSVLFIPRGVYHETVGGSGGRSVTLVIQISTPSYGQLVTRYLADYLSQDPSWREPVVGGWSDESSQRTSATSKLRGLLDALEKQLRALAVEPIFQAQHHGAPARAFYARSQLQRNPAVELDVASAPGHARVSITVRRRTTPAADATIELQHHAAPVFEWLRDHRARFDVASLAARFEDWDEGSLASMVGFLVTHHAIVVLPFEPLPDALRATGSAALAPSAR